MIRRRYLIIVQSIITIHGQISKICRQLAHLNNSQFNTKSTSTSLGNEVNTFRNLGFTISGYHGYDESFVISSILNNKIIGIAGVNENDEGHLWILDGYDYKEIWSGEYIKRWGEEWELVNDHGIRKSKFFHMNWGWRGSFNGYFAPNVFDMLKGAEYDNPNKQYVPGDSVSVSFHTIRVFSVAYN